MNEILAKARAAALNDIKLTDDQPAPRWRVIITDSESPTGIAPVCSGGRSDALHMIDDYPGGPQRDEDGVYDCCPYPQIETYSTVWAEYLVALLNQEAEQANAPAAEAEVLPKADVVAWLVKKAREERAGGTREDKVRADAIGVLASKVARGAIRPDNLRMLPANADFFEPGRTYTREHHGDTIRFVVEYVSASPDESYRVAHGWRTRSWDPGWEPTDSDDLTGWTDTTDGDVR